MKKAVKVTLITITSLLGVAVLTVGGYVAYVALSYNRLPDNQVLEIDHHALEDEMSVDKEYSITTYNIGFGAYSQDYTFFLDEGEEFDGTKNVGKYGKAKSKNEVLFNTNGAIKTISDLNPDFSFFQEVDTDSDRSYHVNQHDMIKEKLTNYDVTHAVNFHSAYLAYPLNDMHGKSNAGISTFSKYKIEEAVRKSFTISTSFSKFFDLDRCFSINKVNVQNGKSLYLINVHMSAYDEGGVIRKKQRDELNACLNELAENNQYVVVGGDFNHDLLTYNPDFNYDIDNKPFNEYIGQKTPEWLQYFFDENGNGELPEQYHLISADNAPSCRGVDIPWEIGHTYVASVDGFIVSNNIEVIEAKTIVTKQGNKNLEHFAYSDHDPIHMRFTLK